MQKRSGSACGAAAASERRITPSAAPLDAYMPLRLRCHWRHNGSSRSKRAPSSTSHGARMRCVTAIS